MPSILLVNDNKIVSRLLQLSSQKHDYSLEEINDYTPSESSYNVIFIDSEKYEEGALEALKETLTFDKLGYIGDKTNSVPSGFDFVLEKPFLPTDFVKLMNENFKVMGSDESGELDAMEEIEGENELDLDSIDLDDELEEMEELESIELDLDDENLEDLSVDIAESDMALTTGIAENLTDDETKEELADIVNEIDNMEEEVLEEMDLDALADEPEIESSVEIEEEIVSEEEVASEEAESSESIVNDEMVKETIEEISEDEKIETDETEESEVEEESSPIDSATMATAVASTVAAVAAVEATSDDEVQEEIEETLNILDGVEAIEQEDDYLKENDHTVQDLADEFDSLNEEEVEKLMAGEEIISEEFSSGEEKVVESNDLEEMITRAVANAITKEMLQEALNDMEITVSLKMKSKDS